MKRIKFITVLSLFTLSATLSFANESPKDFSSLPLSSSELISVMATSPTEMPIEASGLYMGSALTIKDNQAKYMDLLHFNELNIDKAYIFTNVQSNSDRTGNISFATKIFDHSVQIRWTGTSWEKDNTNDINILIGYNKISVLLGYGHKPADSEKITEFHGTIGVGANFTSRLGAYGKILYGAGKGNNNGVKTKITDTLMAFGIEFRPPFFDQLDDELSLTVIGNYFSTTRSFNGKETTNQYNPYLIITPSYKFNYNINENLSWGSQFHMPYILNGKTTYYVYALNGLKAIIVPNILDISLGLITQFPYKVIAEDEYGNFTNYFTFGASLQIAKAVKLDITGTLEPNNGLSIENLLQKKWNITFACNF